MNTYPVLPLFLSIAQIFDGYAQQAASESIDSVISPAAESQLDRDIGSVGAPWH